MPRVIAEVKRRSPSAGWMRSEYQNAFDPVSIASAYLRAGASAISCLTDERFFGGSASHIQPIRRAVALPILRKDFLIDPWQVVESRVIGADAVLLIAECLTDTQIGEFAELAIDLGMEVLAEAHTSENVQRTQHLLGGLPRQRWLLGINNRDLSTMTTDLQRTLDLVSAVSDPSRLVSESGISSPADLLRLAEAGVGGVLVGEHLMRQPDPGQALRDLLARP